MLVILSCGISGMTVAAPRTFIVGDFEYTLNGDSTVGVSFARKTGLTDGERILRIHANVRHEGRDYKVRDILLYGFAGRDDIEQIIIDEGIERIMQYAFFSCRDLKSIRIPSTVYDITGPLFGGCDVLESVTVDNKNKYYDSRNGCNAIIETDEDRLVSACNATIVPDGIKRIGRQSFAECCYVNDVLIPEGVEEIEEEAFGHCASLCNLSLPMSLRIIGEKAFANTPLREITIPENVMEVGSMMFCGCDRLASLTVAHKNRTFDSRQDCNAIVESATDRLLVACMNTRIPKDVKGIAEYAFYGTGVREVIIPSSVDSIPPEAFYCCEFLNRIKVEKGNATFDSRGDCNAIIRTATRTLVAGCIGTDIPADITAIGRGAFAFRPVRKTMIIPQGVESIGAYAFKNCYDLGKVVIPQTVTALGEQAFRGCPHLGIVYIRGNIKCIETRSFADCPNLTVLMIPASVQSIGAKAFMGSTNLRQVLLPSTRIVIAPDAFPEIL